MLLITLGLLCWCTAHFIPTLLPGLKRQLVSRLGPKGYRGIIAIGVFTGLALIIFGWRTTTPTFLFALPPGFRHFGYLLILIAIILIGAANYPTRIKRFVRHPMLTGTALWSFTHLLLNGDSRSVLLFTTLGIWSVAEIVLINRRDGEWHKPPAPPASREIVGIIISLVVFSLLAYFHRFFTGIPIINL